MVATRARAAKGKGAGQERLSDAATKRLRRAAERDLKISRVKEPNRRRDCLADLYQFLPTYFGNVFYQGFTVSRREMIDAILHAARYGGDQAVADYRGGGKTRSALFCTLWLLVGGHVFFPMIISKSGPRANRELRNLKEAIRDSAAFREDFPEVVEPIVQLGGWSSRARQQTAFGVPTRLEWGEETIIFPSIATELLRANGWGEEFESAARGQIMASLGIEGPIRGYSVRNRRPDLALIDDVDDRESANSEGQTDNRTHIIEEDVGGLSGPDQTIARVMLCTLINRTCVAATFTDRTKKPSWRGQVHRLLVTPPERLDKWEHYVELRRDRSADDPDARVAHAFYLADRESMDAGAVLGNPYRFDARPAADGLPKEVSALQAYFNLIADRGAEHVKTEYDNDPPVEAAIVESGLTPTRIQRQLSGQPRRAIPPGCTVLTQGIDCRKVALHWVVRAWRADGLGFYTIDYGVTETIGTIYGSDEGVDLAIKRAILQRMEEFREAGYGIADPLTLVDARYRTEAVYSACAEVGLGIMPAMGIGRSGRCVRSTFTPMRHATPNVKPGDNWNRVRRGNVWVIETNADHWKAWEHDRWLTAPGKPGCMYLFGEPSDPAGRMNDDEKGHLAYAHHVTNEREVEEPYRDGVRRVWKERSENTHWLDASYMASVAANIRGIKLLVGGAKPDRKARPPAPTAQQLKALAMAGRVS
jgi:hypothetical protein